MGGERVQAPPSVPQQMPPTAARMVSEENSHQKYSLNPGERSPRVHLPPPFLTAEFIAVICGCCPPKILFPRSGNCSRHLKINRAARAKDGRSKSDVSQRVIQCYSQELVAFSTAEKSQGLSQLGGGADLPW